MAKQQQHARITRRVAGAKGRREVPASGRRRLHVKKGNVAIEVGRSPDARRIERGIGRLQTQGNARRELRVPHGDFDRAVELAKKKDARLTVKNLTGTKSRQVC